MLDLTTDQIRNLTIWAYERMWDAIDTNTYEGDDWYTMDDAMPELKGKIDVNLWDEEDEHGKSYVRAAAYEVITTPDGVQRTVCDSWERLF